RVRRATAIDGRPTALLSHSRRPAIFVLTPENGTVHEVDPVSLLVKRKTRVMSSATSMRSSPDGGSLWILSRESRMLAHLSSDTLEPGGRIRLPGVPEDFDLASGRAAVSFPDHGSFGVVELRTGHVTQTVPAGPGAGTIRFHDAGRQLWCGNRGNRTMTKF